MLKHKCYYQCQKALKRRRYSRINLYFPHKIHKISLKPRYVCHLGLYLYTLPQISYSFRNGSLTRERIRDRCAGGSWDTFSQLLESTPLGNNGKIGLYFDVQEIQPEMMGTFRFDANEKQVPSFTNAEEIRAIIEGQLICKRVYATKLGYNLGPGSRVLATGGASTNKSILQVIADVFNSPVYILDVPNSACLGAAYRAKHSLLGGSMVPFSEVVKDAPEVKLVATPNPKAQQVYSKMCDVYRRVEKIALSVV